MSERTEAGIAWALRIEGVAAEVIVMAARMGETSPNTAAPRTFTFSDDAGEVVFQAPRERVLYVRRIGLPILPEPVLADDADTRPTIRLPAYMAGPSGQRIATVGRKWAEVFPGLEASLSSCGGLNDDAKAIILFRLTPDDGPDHD